MPLSHHIPLIRKLTEVVTSPSALARANSDALGQFAGQAVAVARPGTTAEVSKLLQYCSAHRIAVVPQGGLTGLCGGAVPTSAAQLVVSFERMNRILEVDPVSSTCAVEAGVVLEHLNAEVGKVGLGAPYDLGSKGACQVGGNISTNAGGLRVVRHGMIRQSVLGLEVVLADGTVLDLMSKCRKDNAGFDLKQLFIGSEGVLGLVTKASLALVQQPLERRVAIIPCVSFDHVLELLMAARQIVHEQLTAFEFFDHASVQALNQAGFADLTRKGLRLDSPFHVLIEASGSAGVDERLDQLCQTLRLDTVLVGVDEKNSRDLWKIRELLPIAIKTLGPHMKYDISVPQNVNYVLVEELRRKYAASSGGILQVYGYGHIGDSNLHLNILHAADADERVLNSVDEEIVAFVAKHRGSISAEHGVGLKKKQAVLETKGLAQVAMMRKLKATLDPLNILNPGKVIAE